jgi:uncharacterized membrane protein
MGGRDLSPRFIGVVTLLAPALLTALIVTQVLADGERLAVGADTAGVAVGTLVVLRGGGVLPCVLISAAVAALLRAVA